MSSINTSNNFKPSPEEMDIIFNYMIENNLSSYSNRTDCVDDGPDLGEWPTDFVATSSTSFTAPAATSSTSFMADDARFGFQSPRPRVQDPEQIINTAVQKIADEVNALYDRKESGLLTEQDKERIWRDGTQEERGDLGEWRPPAVSSLPPLSQRIQRALAGFAALEKECAEKNPLLNYSDDALYE
jgi:hypothetical protein